MEILSKQQYGEYETFVQNHSAGSFMQAPQWADVKNTWKHEVVVRRNKAGVITGGMLILIKPMGVGAMLYAPRGPVCDFTDKKILDDLLVGAKIVAKKHHAHVLKMDPFITVGETHTEEKINAFKSLGCTLNENAAFKDTIQPRHNYMLTYIKGMSEDDLIMSFNSNTRYYIRFAIKNGVLCENKGLDGLDEFYGIYASTGDRQHFTPRSKEYFKQFLSAFPNNARLYMCYYEGEPLCGSICIQYAGRVSHVYGCTKYNKEMRKLHPTYLLQWEMMKWALETDCYIYDMQGIAITPEDSEALYNVYGFKKNFKGDVITTVGEFEMTYRPLYNRLMNTALKVREALKTR